VRTLNLAGISTLDARDLTQVFSTDENMQHVRETVHRIAEVSHVSSQFYIRIGDKLTSLDVSNCFCHMLDGFVSAYDVPTSNNVFQIDERYQLDAKIYLLS
jgi:hypothetical protein